MRGCAVLLVVFLHWCLLEPNYRSDAYLPDWGRIGHAGVDLFFVISGFIMFVIARDYAADFRTAKTFLYHRWARIYPTYWFWFLLALGLYVSVPHWLGLEPGQMSYLVQSFFLLPTWSALLVPVSWTLKYELYFYLVFSVIILLPASWRIAALIGWGGYMIAGQAICYDAPVIQCNKNLFLTMHPFGLEFLFGTLAGWLYLRGTITRPRMLTLAGACLLLTGFFVYIVAGLRLDDNLWYRVLLFGLPAAVLLSGYVEMESRCAMTAPRWLIYIGTASYTIYLSHFLLLTLLFAALMRYDWLPTPWLDVLVLALTLGIGIAAYHSVERPLLRLMRGNH
jgi:exopolysaccharide production protein ExoZ